MEPSLIAIQVRLRTLWKPVTLTVSILNLGSGWISSVRYLSIIFSSSSTREFLIQKRWHKYIKEKEDFYKRKSKLNEFTHFIFMNFLPLFKWSLPFPRSEILISFRQDTSNKQFLHTTRALRMLRFAKERRPCVNLFSSPLIDKKITVSLTVLFPQLLSLLRLLRLSRLVRYAGQWEEVIVSIQRDEEW